MEAKNNKKTLQRRYKSLRSILAFWFFLFSIVPLLFLTGTSIVQFREAIDDELNKRLEVNAREFFQLISDSDKYLKSNGERNASNRQIINALTKESFLEVRTIAKKWLNDLSINRISVFDKTGKLRVSLSKDINQQIKNESNLESGDVFLNPKMITELKEQGQISYHDITQSTGLEIIFYSQIINKKKQIIGYLEKIINMDSKYLLRERNRLGLEILILDENGQPIATSHDELNHRRQHPTYESKIKQSQLQFDLNITDELFGFIIKPLPVQFGNKKIYVGLGTSKKDSFQIQKDITKTLFTLLGVMIILLIITLLSVTKLVLRPLSHLVEAAQRIEGGEIGTQIRINSETEIGILTESFNRMSQKVAEAHYALENNIKKLQSTQQKLVQSEKMGSLGQLVAGVAHELNNPIGFIYSNMEHLKDYSEKLAKLIHIAEKTPKKLEKAKKDLEYDYLVEDLPKLIKSCQEGANRVRNIVTGLKDFSRLDESQLKEIYIEEAIDTTLNLLQGEIKNRIKVHKNYTKTPRIRCFASQLNQVFMNILLNATQAIEGKGEIWITTKVEKDELMLSIKDSGHGMSSDVKEKIFDPFFTTKPVGEGTGLGLSISYGIIENHNGRISVHTKQGEGTEFYISFPLDGAHSNPQK